MEEEEEGQEEEEEKKELRIWAWERELILDLALGMEIFCMPWRLFKWDSDWDRLSSKCLVRKWRRRALWEANTRGHFPSSVSNKQGYWLEDDDFDEVEEVEEEEVEDVGSWPT